MLILSWLIIKMFKKYLLRFLLPYLLIRSHILRNRLILYCLHGAATDSFEAVVVADLVRVLGDGGVTHDYAGCRLTIASLVSSCISSAEGSGTIANNLD